MGTKLSRGERTNAMEMREDFDTAPQGPVNSCPVNTHGEVYYCRNCEFEVLQKKNKVTFVLDWVFLAVEMFLGLVLFAIEIHYDLGVELFGRYYVTHDREPDARKMLYRCRLIHAITTTFPLTFLPIIILTKVMMRRDSVIAVTCILFGLIGFGCYLGCGIVVLALKNLDSTSQLSTMLYGILAVVIAVIYLTHGTFEVFRNATYIKRRWRAACRYYRKRRSA